MKYLNKNRRNSKSGIGIFRLVRHLLPLITIAILFSSCGWKKKENFIPPHIPYPDSKFAEYLQAQVDSSRFMWFVDVKRAASSFCNDQVYNEAIAVSTDSVIILSENLFHAKAEVHLAKKIIILTMERPFKDKGTKSIWQVIKLEEKK